MGTITASLERSLQNCSLNQSTTATPSPGAGGGRSSSDSRTHPHPQSTIHSNASSSDDNSACVHLNSHLSLPYHWEQCLNLKTGEIYYINWRNGMKAKEDPRTSAAVKCYYSEEEEEYGSNGYDSEGRSTESSPCSSTSTRESFRSIKKKPLAPAGTHQLYDDDEEEDDDDGEELSSESILVVAGCKSCLMYYMVPKHLEGCPKCSGQLLHFAANHKPLN